MVFEGGQNGTFDCEGTRQDVEADDPKYLPASKRGTNSSVHQNCTWHRTVGFRRSFEVFAELSPLPGGNRRLTRRRNKRAPAITPGLKDKRNGGSLLTQKYQPLIDGVNSLYGEGARLFRLDDKNRPAEARGFYNRQLSLDQLLEHVERGQRLGIEPRSIGAVVVDIDAGDPDHFIQNFRPLSMYGSKTPGRVHAYYRHVGEKVSPRPFNAPLFRIAGDLKHERSYVALYDAVRLANDLNRGSLGVPYLEVERALVTGPLAVQGGQLGPLGSPVVSFSQPRRFDTLSVEPAA